MQLTSENYYSQEANKEYMSVSGYKDFAGTYGKMPCEFYGMEKLKLYLKSLSNSGRLMYRNVIPYTPEILATLTGHQVGTVEKALDVFKKLDLIEMLDNGAIYMMDIQNFIGQSSSEADRQREYYNP